MKLIFHHQHILPTYLCCLVSQVPSRPIGLLTFESVSFSLTHSMGNFYRYCTSGSSCEPVTQLPYCNLWFPIGKFIPDKLVQYFTLQSPAGVVLLSIQSILVLSVDACLKTPAIDHSIVFKRFYHFLASYNMILTERCVKAGLATSNFIKMHCVYIESKNYSVELRCCGVIFLISKYYRPMI